MIFIDSNVPMYIAGNDPRRKIEARGVLERLASEQHMLVTSSEVFQELLHRYVSSGHRDAIEPVFQTLRQAVDQVFAVEEADVLAAKDLVHVHPRLSARDAVHAATMRRCQITQIVSFDGGFDEVAGITRLPSPQPDA